MKLALFDDYGNIWYCLEDVQTAKFNDLVYVFRAITAIVHRLEAAEETQEPDTTIHDLM